MATGTGTYTQLHNYKSMIIHTFLLFL